MLHCIQSIYNSDTARVHTQTGLSDAFQCTIGVKQGCPMSPNLFGLYLDDLQECLENTTDHDSPELWGISVPLLLYADDLAIVSHSLASLQRLMDALQAFCHRRRLTVNVEKTKAMVFSRRTTPNLLTYQDQHIEQVTEFRYLGLDFHQIRVLLFAPHIYMQQHARPYLP